MDANSCCKSKVRRDEAPSMSERSVDLCLQTENFARRYHGERQRLGGVTESIGSHGIKSGTTRRSFKTVAERSQVSPQLEIAASRKGRGGRRNCQALRGMETDGERRRTNFEFQLPPPSFPPSHSSTFLPSRHHLRAAEPIMLYRLDGPEIHGHTRRIKAQIWGVEH